MTALTPIEAQTAARMLEGGTLLIDVREADERARLRIPGSRHAPLSRLPNALPAAGSAPAMIFYCRSGNRTATQAPRLAALASGPAYALAGGIEAWHRAGLPVLADARAPLELMRQVQIAAGLLILLGVVLGALVAPGFYGLAGFVGAGLLVAGVTGWCGMARLLALMPWNRRPAAA